MISIITITEQLNSLKKEYSELPYSEFKEKLKEIISYNEFPKYLIDERVVFKIGKNVVFSKGMIHRSQISPILEALRERNNIRVNKYLEKRKAIEEAISILEKYGYKVVKQ